ncbi:uncharacterized protein LOC141572785 [Rhinolophus sinicus]|uniref:uncharacterized protein LOC141572785 n=1 Tax=Rhinolophus sinicus TaxID=89399 RepID=UPI003D7A4F96
METPEAMQRSDTFEEVHTGQCGQKAAGAVQRRERCKEPEHRRLPAPPAATFRVSETPAPARVAAPGSVAAAAFCATLPLPAPSRPNLNGVGVLSACPPHRASREPRAPTSSPGLPLRSRDGKSWRWRRFPSPAERAPQILGPPPPPPRPPHLQRRLLRGPVVPGPDPDPGDPSPEAARTGSCYSLPFTERRQHCALPEVSSSGAVEAPGALGSGSLEFPSKSKKTPQAAGMEELRVTNSMLAVTRTSTYDNRSIGLTTAALRPSLTNTLNKGSSGLRLSSDWLGNHPQGLR